METTIVTVVIVLLVIWYFGKPLNAIIANTGEMASDEFSVMRIDQQTRLYKERIKQTAKIKDLADQEAMSDQEFKDFFAVLNKKEEK